MDYDAPITLTTRQNDALNFDWRNAEALIGFEMLGGTVAVASIVFAIANG